MMMVSLCLSAQNIDDFISEKTKDVAYSASNTMLINKKWYMFDKDFDIYTTYYIFRANKTGERKNEGQKNEGQVSVPDD